MSDPLPDPSPIDRRLYDRSVATLIGSWAYFAAGSPGARVIRTSTAAIAVFTHAPDREIFNNAILDRDLAEEAVADSLAAIEATYDEAGIERFAVWIHETQAGIADRLRRAGYEHDETTRTMVAELDALAHVETSGLTLLPHDYQEFLRINGLPGDLFPGLGGDGRIYLAEADSAPAATLMAYDHDGDCGLYNVATSEFARGRGLGTALTALALQDARSRGCTTASLQATPMAERVYAAVGFRDLGCFNEYVRAEKA